MIKNQTTLAIGKLKYFEKAKKILKILWLSFDATKYSVISKNCFSKNLVAFSQYLNSKSDLKTCLGALNKPNKYCVFPCGY